MIQQAVFRELVALVEPGVCSHCIQFTFNVYYTYFIQGVFLTGAPLKVLSVRLISKSHQKSFKCQNLHTDYLLFVHTKMHLSQFVVFYF